MVDFFAYIACSFSGCLTYYYCNLPKYNIFQSNFNPLPLLFLNSGSLLDFLSLTANGENQKVKKIVMQTCFIAIY